MLKQFIEFKELFDIGKIKITNNKLNHIFYSYTFLHITKNSDLKEKEIISKNLHDSKVAIINQNTENNINNTVIYSIVSFKKTIIIIQQSSKTLNQILISIVPNLIIFNLQNENKPKEAELLFYDEIESFNKYFHFISQSKLLNNQIMKVIKICISGYLIKEGYANLRCNKEFNFFSESEEENNEDSITDFNEDDFIEIRILGIGSSSKAKLVYHIEREKLFVIKEIHEYLEEFKLLERENNNYHEIKYFHLPKYYGKIKNKNYPVIEFIDGETLANIKNLNFKETDKISIIFQIMMIIKYLHKNEFIYRDLKPNNVIVDKYNRVFLIDFDRMVKFNNSSDIDMNTKDFSSNYVAPEVTQGIIKYENDIFSLGQMIRYIVCTKNPKIKVNATKKTIKNNSQLFQMYSNCVDEIEKRPSILEIIFEFYFYFSTQIQKHILHKDEDIEYFHGLINFEREYVTRDIYETIHYYTLAANQKILKAQYFLGFIYSNEQYIKQDINKSIYYYSLAAEQNSSHAQFYLGFIYEKGNCIKRDINKAIYYYSLAANQNNLSAQFNLGLIYERCECIKPDIDKAIYYYQLAANQNDSKAQYQLGNIYFTKQYNKIDIDKAIYYFSLASNQNLPDAQHNLGVIYSNMNYNKTDINKAIHYYSLAANQNFLRSQFNLGIIYYDKRYNKVDINKSIYYFSLAAKQNCSKAQFNLGVIYHKGHFVIRDIDKAIYYYSLSADQNEPNAQYHLGVIYGEGKYIKRDINKAIYYYSLAANQKHVLAIYNLGVIYDEGKYVERDINKAIYYYSLASDQNHSDAQFLLGNIYLQGKYIKQDINKSFYYFFQAAYHNNNPNAQYVLGLIYCKGFFLPKNMNKGINLIKKSSLQGFDDAHFAIGYFYHEGIYIENNIEKAIHHYKEASSFYHQFAKNNLGVIYKNGFKDKIEKNLGLSIEYFKEAIRQKQDILSMYNLSRIYIYEELYEYNIDKSIDLLIKSSNYGFSPSIILLSLLLIKKNEFNINLKKELENQNEKFPELFKTIYQTINNMNLFNKSVFNHYFNKFRECDYIYKYNKKEISFYDFQLIKENKKSPQKQNISSDFYDGFGI